MQQQNAQFDSLFKACQENKLEDVERLIKDGADPHAQNISGQSVVDIVTGLTEMSSKEKLNYALFLNLKEGDVEKVKLFLVLGANPNIIYPNKNRPLHEASKNGHLEIVKELIEAGADVNAKDLEVLKGFTPLHLACENGHLEVVKALIEAGASVDAKSSEASDCVPLHFSSRNGHLEVVKELLKAGANVDAESSEVWNRLTPLHLACENGHLEIAKALIKAGASVDAKSSEASGELTPVHLACENGHLEVVKELIKYLNPEDKNDLIDFFTKEESEIKPGEDGLKAALIINSEKGNNEKVKMLLVLGGDVNQTDSNGFSLLHIASLFGHLEVVKELINAGADVNAQNQNQKTVKFAVINPSPEGSSSNIPTSLAFSPFGTEPLHLASENGHLEVVKALIEAKANIEAKTSGDELTPLHIASENGHLEVVKALIEAKANLEAKTSRDELTPLHLACENGHFDVVDKLIDVGAIVNARTPDGFTPIYFASEYGYLEIAKKLIEENALVNAKTSQASGEYTPLHVASYNGHLDVVKFLIQRGADIEARTTEDFGNYTPLDVANIKSTQDSKMIVDFLTSTMEERGIFRPDPSPSIEFRSPSPLSDRVQNIIL